LSSEVAETAIVYPGTVLGDGCKLRTALEIDAAGLARTPMGIPPSHLQHAVAAVAEPVAVLGHVT